MHPGDDGADGGGPHRGVLPLPLADGPATAARHVRAELKIQDGCDRKCSFCATRVARGASRSRPIEELVAEARLLAEDLRDDFAGVDAAGLDPVPVPEQRPELLARAGASALHLVAAGTAAGISYSAVAVCMVDPFPPLFPGLPDSFLPAGSRRDRNND